MNADELVDPFPMNNQWNPWFWYCGLTCNWDSNRVNFVNGPHSAAMPTLAKAAYMLSLGIESIVLVPAQSTTNKTFLESGAIFSIQNDLGTCAFGKCVLSN